MFCGYRHFIVYIKVDDIYEGIAQDVETKFNTPNYELGRSLPKGLFALLKSN